MASSRFSIRKKNNVYLYTKGNEFSLDGIEYIGEYHYDGIVPKTGPIPLENSKILRRLYLNNNHYVYDSFFKFQIPVLDFVSPKPHLYKPKEQSYVSGYESRYFVEKIDDETSYAIEIDQVQYQNINKPRGIDGGLYLSAIVNWKLTGRQSDIIEHNKLEIYKATKKVPSVAYSIKNYLEFARITLI